MKKKILLITSLGNALEFFDFILYGAFFTVIASVFFPVENQTISILMSIGGFGVGFIMRPFGALIFGYFGDTFGRKNTLSASIMCMGLPTFFIGALPGYNEIGIISPVLIVMGRLVQGVCIGGEYNGAFIFASEHNQGRSLGFIGGIMTMSCGIGAFTATGLSILANAPNLPEWTWRIPFFVGSFISILGYYIRRSLTETPEFLNTSAPQKSYLFKTIKHNKAFCFLSFAIGAVTGGLVYTLFGFLNIYVTQYCGISFVEAAQINLIAIFGFIISSPFFGILYDRMCSFLFLKTVSCVLFLIMIPIFWFISSSNSSLILFGEIFLSLCAAAMAGTGLAIMQKLFPVRERYTTISLFFNLGIGILGGSSPFFYMQAIEVFKESLYFPAYYLMCLVSLFYGALLLANTSFMPPKTTEEDLDEDDEEESFFKDLSQLRQ